MEFRFDTMVCSNMGKENSDAGHVKRSSGLEVPHLCFIRSTLLYLLQQQVLYHYEPFCSLQLQLHTQEKQVSIPVHL